MNESLQAPFTFTLCYLIDLFSFGILRHCDVHMCRSCVADGCVVLACEPQKVQRRSFVIGIFA